MKLSLVFVAVVVPLGGLALFACAGTLDDPDRFRDSSAATAPAPPNEPANPIDSAPDAAGPAPAAPDAAAPACSDVVKDILTPQCAKSCHLAGDPFGDLASPNLRGRLRGTPVIGGKGLWIDPARPEESVLVTKLESMPPYGARMPIGAPALDAAGIACVREWAASPE